MNYADFIRRELAPAVIKTLGGFFKDYCNGHSPESCNKEDGTPAGIADRKTEKLLRHLIHQAYPSHSIWGEEYGLTTYSSAKSASAHPDPGNGNAVGRPDTEEDSYIWVIDPLDGTREYLAKRPGCFGSLIGLIKNARPITGAVIDPLSGKIFQDGPSVSADTKNMPHEDISFSTERMGGVLRDRVQSRLRSEAASPGQPVLACTSPSTMFKASFAKTLESRYPTLLTHTNCMGFTALTSGKVDAVIEADLSLHDIVPVLPLLYQHGMTTINEKGVPYKYILFNVNQPPQKYTIITARSSALANELLSYYKEHHG